MYYGVTIISNEGLLLTPRILAAVTLFPSVNYSLEADLPLLGAVNFWLRKPLAQKTISTEKQCTVPPVLPRSPSY
jgi:hypothetical protein